MPRSSRHKSHKQHKHSSKDTREKSDSEEDVKLKDRGVREEAASVRVSRDSGSTEKRKLVSIDSGNGDLSVEYGSSKRRKERVDRVDGPVSDRWNGGDKEGKGEAVLVDSEKGSKVKVSVDSKSKSSRRHESLSERKLENVSAPVEIEEVKKSSASKVESKWKSEKDLGRKEVHQYKDVKDREHGSEREKKAQDVKRESKIDTVQGPAKRDLDNAEWQMHDGMRNSELEKELDKRVRRRRDETDDKDRYQDDCRDTKGSRSSTREDRTKNGRYRDEKQKEDKYRDKYSEDSHKDYRYRDDKRGDDYSKDHTSHRHDTKHSRDESKSMDNHHKKSKPQDRNRDGSPRPDDRTTSYKDDRGRKRGSDDNDNLADHKSRSAKEHRYVDENRYADEKKSMSTSKIESHADRGRSQSRAVDMDSSVGRSRRNSSPSSSSRFAKDDQHRSIPKQAEPKYKDALPEERNRSNATPSRDRVGVSGVSERLSDSRSMEKLQSNKKLIQEDENKPTEAERSPISDAHASPMKLVEKSHSSTSIDRRYPNRNTSRRSLDVEETGRRNGGCKDGKDNSGNEERGSREPPPLEKPAADEISQADGDTVSVSSSFNRGSHFPSSSSSFLPPPHPSRVGISSPSVLESSEDDNRGKSNNRYRRPNDFNVSRGQGNAWKGVPNWPSPLANGFIPFQHGPPPGGFHPMMQQFPAPQLFGIRPSMDLNHTGVPYHIPDADRFSSHGRPFGWQNSVDESCPPHMHGWDGSNGVFGDESHMYGRPDWDQNRHMMNGRGWEASTEMWKGQNNAVNMEMNAAPEKDDHQLRASVDEGWAHPGPRSRNERSRPGSRAESIEIKRSDDTLPAQKSKEAHIVHTREKTPEPSKTLNNDSNFCHVYLSKLDISVDLTHPELYKQCMGLFDMEGNSTDDGATKNIHLEEPREARLKISDTWGASLFPAIKDTLLQRALNLYKKQGEEMRAKCFTSPIPFPEPESTLANGGVIPEPLPAANLDESMPFPASDQNKLEPVSSPAQSVVEEPVLTSNHEKGEEAVVTAEEQFSAVDLEKAEEPVTILNQEKANQEKVEEHVTILNQEKEEEPVTIHNQEKANQEKAEEMLPILNQGEADKLVESSDIKKSEEAISIPGQDKAEETVPFPDQDEADERAPIPDQGKAEEPDPIQDLEKVEVLVPILDGEKADEPAPITADQEMENEPTPRSCEEVEQVILISVNETPKNPVPTLCNEEKVEGVMNANLEELEAARQEQSPQNESSQLDTTVPMDEDVMIVSSDSEGNGCASISEERKEVSTDPTCDPLGCASISEERKAVSGDMMCDPFGCANSSSEVCEALMPQSIECSKLNLSRIHNSPESTH